MWNVLQRMFSRRSQQVAPEQIISRAQTQSKKKISATKAEFLSDRNNLPTNVPTKRRKKKSIYSVVSKTNTNEEKNDGDPIDETNQENDQLEGENTNNNGNYGAVSIQNYVHTADEPVAMEEIDDEDDNDNGSGYLDVQEDDHDSLDSSRANDVDENNNSSSNRRKRFRPTKNQLSQYIEALADKELEIVGAEGDGNCLFRTVSHQMYGRQDHHAMIRSACVDYMENEAAYFSNFVVGGHQTFAEYLSNMRQDGEWGDEPEIQAMCEMYDRPADVYVYDEEEGCRVVRRMHNVRLKSNSGEVLVNCASFNSCNYRLIVILLILISLLMSVNVFLCLFMSFY